MEALVDMLLRPYRSVYSLNDLGRRITDKYTRSDEQCINPRNLTLSFSYYHNKIESDSCIIYCHCNSGSRV